MLIALGVGFLLGNVFLKNLVMRPRPFVTHTDLTALLVPEDPWSFPSGHTLSSFAAASALYFFHHKTGFLAFLLAAAIAFSRLYASVHYPTDVLTGAVIGVLCGIIAAWLTDRVTDQCHTLRLRKGKNESIQTPSRQYLYLRDRHVQFQDSRYPHAAFLHRHDDAG